MHGWAGKILRVDLARGNHRIEDLDPHIARDFIGGRGLATKLLFNEIDPKIDAFSPENKLFFAAGPLTGSGAIGGSRFMVVTKSPLTDGIGCANAGGYFGPELRFAGYDIVILEDKAPEPVYLSIENDEVQIKPASHLWGKTTVETEDLIRSEIKHARKAKETQICCIGPAGENLVRMASIMHSGHAAGRSGVGAVMGAKNLKAVVVRGTKGIPIADVDSFQNLIAVFSDRIRKSPVLERRILYGTWTGISRAYKFGVMATKNFREGRLEGADGAEKVLRHNFFVKSHTCFACPFQEFKTTRVTDPDFRSEGDGPEWESFCLLGPNCGITNLAAIVKAGHVCNELGMDTISAGGTIACAMELYEKGFLPEKEVGYSLHFGNDKAMVELIEKTGWRQGFGDMLAEGGYRLAEKYGHPELFMGVKKQEFPGWHPQGFQILALGYATSNRGACHLKNIHYYDDSRFETGGQAVLAKTDQDYIAAMDSCGLCYSIYVRDFLPWCEEVPLLLEAVTGAGYTKDSMMLAGERIWNIERLFNLNAGLTAKDDTLPPRILEEPVLEEPGRGQVVKLDEMLPEYYEVRGWDRNGVPTPEKLAELGLNQEGGR
ncbi:aldehyde ferredoxin oxidoreductase family protein [Dehalococcoidia bacterium]|nr:aldehyde ferredoxin oxidoreductase family protein [Dehalococcoidia bacterium]